MSSNVDPGGGGGDSFLSRFFSVSGLDSVTNVPTIERFRPFALIKAIAFGTLLGFATGTINLISAIGNGIVTLFGGLTSAFMELIGLVFGTIGIVETGTATSAASLETSGIIAAILAIAVVGVALYVVSLGVDRIVE